MLLLTAVMTGVQLIQHIEDTGLKEEGILRIPGSLTRVKVIVILISSLAVHLREPVKGSRVSILQLDL